MKCILIFLLSASLFGAAPKQPTIAILGGGVGALSSALYLSRAGFEPVVIEGKHPGGALMQTHVVQNWPGELEIEGPDLTQKIRKQVEANGARFVSGEVIKVDFSHQPFRLTIQTLEGKQKILSADACIIAMGSEPRFLNIPGEQTYWGHGVTNCAVCDGALYRDQVVGVVGGGDAAVTQGLYLASLAKEVHLFVRKDQFRATEKKRLSTLLGLPNVHVHYHTQIQEVQGDGEKVTHVKLDSGEMFLLDGLFLAIGSEPNTAIFKGQLKCDAKGYLLVGPDMQTSVPHVYAIGDIVDPVYKQAITAAGDGCKAALHLQNLLQSEGTIAAPEQKPLFIPSIASPSVIEIASEEQLQQELQGELPVLIDFYATWCGPCQLLAPLFESTAQTYSGRIKFLKVNVDENPTLTRKYQIRGMPTVLLIDPSGTVMERKVGTDQIAHLLRSLEEML